MSKEAKSPPAPVSRVYSLATGGWIVTRSRGALAADPVLVAALPVQTGQCDAADFVAMLRMWASDIESRAAEGPKCEECEGRGVAGGIVYGDPCKACNGTGWAS